MPKRRRVFLGSSWSEQGTALFPGLQQDIDAQAVPQIPSGQPKTSCYSSNHFSFFLNKPFEAAPGLHFKHAPEWAELNFKPEYLDEHTKGDRRYMKPHSGKKMRLRAEHRYAPYTAKDLKILKPRTC